MTDGSNGSSLSLEDLARSKDRLKIAAARASGNKLRLLLLFLGPGVLVMLGENDGPSMLSYAASGAMYGIGFFIPFIVITFAVALFVQDMGVRIGEVTHRGFGELIFQRFGRFWGWFSSADLLVTNLVTLIAELVAIRVGLAYFGIAPWVAVVGAGGLVAISSFAGSFDRWEKMALGLAAFNALFVVAAFFAHPSPGAVGRALGTWTPFPHGSLSAFLLIVASDIGATVTPWMLFFQQSATADKGLTSADLSGGRADTSLGALLAVITAIGALLVATPLYAHHITVTSQGGAGYASALKPYIGSAGSTIFALGLIEAGALATMTISASTAYAIGEVVPGGAHSFNDKLASSRLFHGANVGMAVAAGLITLIPGAPLLLIALNANLLATVLMPAGLVFLLILAADRELMGDAANGVVRTSIGVVATVVITIAGAGYAIVSFLQSYR